MIEPTFSIDTLFEQLGLPAEPEQIKAFCKKHSLKDGEFLHDAEFWTPQQASFLKEGIAADADWSEVIDELDVQLRV